MTLNDDRASRQVVKTEIAEHIVTTTLFCVVGTSLLVAPLTAPIIRALNLHLEGDPAPPPTAQSTTGSRTNNSDVCGDQRREVLINGADGHSDGHGRSGHSWLHDKWGDVDRRFIKPCFGGRGAPGCAPEPEHDAED